MNIQGLQKLTLLDFPGKTACTVFLGGCDFRCPFCHNSGLLDAAAPAELTDTDLLAFLEKRRGLLDGVAFTGGTFFGADTGDGFLRINLGCPRVNIEEAIRRLAEALQ